MTTTPLAPNTALALMQASQAEANAAADKAKQPKTAVNVEKAKETATEFEAMFVSEMMKPMFETIDTDSMFGGGKGEEVFRGLLVEEYGKLIAQTGSIGLADHVKDAIIQMQENANNAKQ